MFITIFVNGLNFSMRRQKSRVTKENPIITKNTSSTNEYKRDEQKYEQKYIKGIQIKIEF